MIHFLLKFDLHVNNLYLFYLAILIICLLLRYLHFNYHHAARG
jgi:hypothetical protein